MSGLSRALLALLIIFLMFIGSLTWATAATPNSEERIALTFDRVPLPQLLMVFYDQCEKRGLVFDPGVSKAEEAVTLKTPSMPCSQVKVILTDLMQRVGMAFDARKDYDVVKVMKARDERDEYKQLIYRPRFRDAADLAELAMVAVRKGTFAHHRRGSPVQVNSAEPQRVTENGSNGASLMAKQIDKLIFVGPPEEVDAVNDLLSRLDSPSPQVEISVGIYEFQSGAKQGSAVSAAVSLFKSKVGLTINGGTGIGSSLKLNLPSIEAALSLLDEDTRFRYVARPRVLAKDGEQVSFNAGQDVRVVGAVTTDRNGNPVQSIVTMNAGVMLTATPLIRGDIVDLTLHQVVSDFVASPNNDPSVVKRDLMNRLMVQPGFVYVLGGLEATRKTHSKRRFFGFEVGESFEKSDTEIVLLLSVRTDDAGTVSHGEGAIRQ
jgi:general secretion pathway protein D